MSWETTLCGCVAGAGSTPTAATNGSRSLGSNKNGERRKTGSWTLRVELSLKLQDCSSREYLGRQQ
jgi:hypothetical protein